MEDLTTKILIALISSVTTFILGVLYNTFVLKKQLKLSLKSFLTISPMLMKRDFHEIHKGDKTKHLLTHRYKEIRDYYNNNRILVPALSFLVLKNLGPGIILECRIHANYYVKEQQQYTWNVNQTIDIIEKDEPVYICVDDFKAPVGTFFLDEAEITYKTQANEIVCLNMEFVNDICVINYSTIRFRLFRKKWTRITVPLGLEWEIPNK